MKFYLKAHFESVKFSESESVLNETRAWNFISSAPIIAGVLYKWCFMFLKRISKKKATEKASKKTCLSCVSGEKTSFSTRTESVRAYRMENDFPFFQFIIIKGIYTHILLLRHVATFPRKTQEAHTKNQTAMRDLISFVFIFCYLDPRYNTSSFNTFVHCYHTEAHLVQKLRCRGTGVAMYSICTGWEPFTASCRKLCANTRDSPDNLREVASFR